ncbi:MAG: response regulator, partial [Xanthomonadaceae bacterium]|nr:response regulator [Xanthomonadaceae bacterium]
VLLVEDQPMNQELARDLLERAGMTVVTANNGEEALQKLTDAGPFDGVLMDCQMPVLDGYSASRSWRERERQEGAERLPIIAMTANAMAGDRQTCLDAGMDDYLTKPVARDHLIQTLRRWLPEPDESEVLSEIGASDMPAPQSVDADAAPATDPLPAVEAMPALDPGIVEDLQDMMGAEFARLVAVYLEDSPGQLLTLQAAAFAGDVAAMIAPAHSLKSASANLGALEFSELARQVEHQAREKRLAEPVAAAIRLAAEYERVEQALKAITRPEIAR